MIGWLPGHLWIKNNTWTNIAAFSKPLLYTIHLYSYSNDKVYF